MEDLEKQERDNKVLDILQSHDGMQTTFQIGIKCYNEGYQKAMQSDEVKLLRNEIESLESALKHAHEAVVKLEKAQEWIPVSERLPEGIAPVIVYLKNDDMVFEAQFIPPNRWHDDELGDINPSHWMYLPTPPKK